MAKKKEPVLRSLSEEIALARKRELIKQRKEFAKEIAQRDRERALAPQPAFTQVEEQQRITQEKQRRFGAVGSTAEQLEIEAVSFNEIPFLEDLERQQADGATPSTRSFIETEKRITDSFPD